VSAADLSSQIICDFASWQSRSRIAGDGPEKPKFASPGPFTSVTDGDDFNPSKLEGSLLGLPPPSRDRAMLIFRFCVCGAPFVSTRRDARYCCGGCRQFAYRQRRRAARPDAERQAGHSAPLAAVGLARPWGRRPMRLLGQPRHESRRTVGDNLA
jgi:hypothetical protein